MAMILIRRGIFIALFSAVFLDASFGQVGLCPPNLDFELGDFTNWNCTTGSVSAPGNVNTYNPTATGVVPNRHTIITAATAGLDPYGNFPQLCPNGSGTSVRLGNNLGGGQGESISYTYTIPSTLTVFSMMFHYAVVFQDPNHLAYQQPRFRASIKDLSTGSPISCVTFDFVASSSSLPGFQPSPSGGGVLYKSWTPVTMNLSAYIGRTIQIEFITTDCIFSQHFGYAYVDVNTNCNGAIEGTTLCPGNNSVTLTAPYGFQAYEWYADNTFSNLLATTQTLPLNPAPAVGTIIPVIVIPYPGYGCRDTLYATITISPNPVSNAGPDATICKYGQVQIGGPPTTGYSYQWTPAAQVSNATSSNPFAWNIPPNPQEFIVKTTDILTGCFSYDTTYVTNATVDTVIRLSGPPGFCVGQTGPTLSVNPSTSIQWYEGNNLIPGATGTTLQPQVPGQYWAQISQGGCTDSTRRIQISVFALPLASFTVNSDTACITSNSFQFTNTSSIGSAATLTHTWIFSDGSTQVVTDAVKSFSQTGVYDVELYTTSSEGCKDTAYGKVYVMPNAIPNFSWDSICTNRPVRFLNLSNANGSPQVNYTWTFNNGSPPVNTQNPSPVIYTTSGANTVSLQVTALGCESDPVTVTKPININQAIPGERYRELTVPQGSAAYMHARDIPGSVYAWKPQVQLSSYNTRYTEFYATGNDVLYLIEITNKHNCVTTDTMLVQVLKKTGYYLPTGFTPNGDGLNDIVRPYLVGMKSLKSFSIFNRWGDRLFHTTKTGEGWNGKLNGVAQNAGVYVWILEFFDTNDKLVVEKGTLTLIR